MMRIILMCVVALTLVSCSTMDGGIIGSGTRADCEAKMRPDGTPAPVPEECKRQTAAPR